MVYLTDRTLGPYTAWSLAKYIRARVYPLSRQTAGGVDVKSSLTGRDEWGSENGESVGGHGLSFLDCQMRCNQRGLVTMDPQLPSGAAYLWPRRPSSCRQMGSGLQTVAICR